jgi:hypothetical protein
MILKHGNDADAGEHGRGQGLAKRPRSAASSGSRGLTESERVAAAVAHGVNGADGRRDGDEEQRVLGGCPPVAGLQRKDQGERRAAADQNADDADHRPHHVDYRRLADPFVIAAPAPQPRPVPAT